MGKIAQGTLDDLHMSAGLETSRRSWEVPPMLGRQLPLSTVLPSCLSSPHSGAP